MSKIEQTGGSQLTPESIGASSSGGPSGTPSNENVSTFQSKLTQQSSVDFTTLNKPENKESKDNLLQNVITQATNVVASKIKSTEIKQENFPLTIPVPDSPIPNTHVVVTYSGKPKPQINLELQTSSPEANTFLNTPENLATLQKGFANIIPTEKAQISVTSELKTSLGSAANLSTSIQSVLTESKVFSDPTIKLPAAIPLKDPNFEGVALVVTSKTQGGVKSFDIQLKTPLPEHIQTLSDPSKLKELKSSIQTLLPSNASLDITPSINFNALTEGGVTQIHDSLAASFLTAVTQSNVRTDPNVSLPLTVPLNNPLIPDAELVISSNLVDGSKSFAFNIQTGSPETVLALNKIGVDIELDVKKITPDVTTTILQNVGESLDKVIKNTGIFSDKPKVALPITLPLKNQLITGAKVTLSKNEGGEVVFQITPKTPKQAALLSNPDNLKILNESLKILSNGKPFTIDIPTPAQTQTFSAIAQAIKTKSSKPLFEGLTSQEKTAIVPQLSETITSLVSDALAKAKGKPFAFTAALKDFPIDGIKINVSSVIDKSGKPQLNIQILSDSSEATKFLNQNLKAVQQQIIEIGGKTKPTTPAPVTPEAKPAPTTSEVKSVPTPEAKPVPTTAQTNASLFEGIPFKIEISPTPKAKAIDSIATSIISAFKSTNALSTPDALSSLMTSIKLDPSILPNTHLKFGISNTPSGSQQINVTFDTQSLEATNLLNTPGSLASLQSTIQKELGLPPNTVFNFNMNTDPNLNTLSTLTTSIVETMLDNALTLNAAENPKPVTVPLPSNLQKLYPTANIEVAPVINKDGTKSFTINVQNAPLELSQLLNKPEFKEAIPNIISQELNLPESAKPTINITSSKIADGLQTELNNVLAKLKNEGLFANLSENNPIKIPLNKTIFPNTEIVIKVKGDQLIISAETNRVDLLDTLKNSQPAILNFFQTQLQIPTQNLQVNVPAEPSLNNLMAEMVQNIRTNLPDPSGKQEVVIQLKNEVIPGTEIRMTMDGGTLKMTLATSSAHSQNFLNTHQASLQAHLQKNLSVENVSITVQNTSDSEQSDPQGGSRQEYVPTEEEEN